MSSPRFGFYFGSPSRRSAPALRLIFFAATLAAAAACSAPDSATAAKSDAPKGSLLIVGGGPQPDSLVRAFVDLAGGAGKARIVIFAMASEDGLAGGNEKADDLRKLGAEAINVYITREQADQDSIVHLLDGATGIWFGGGDQVRLTRAIGGTRVEQAIHDRYSDGAVVGGTSAGAAVMSTPMITGDERHPGGARPDSTDPFKIIARDDIITDSGFGLIQGAIVDQHFLRRKRHNRLISTVLEHPTLLGIGIDESTALLVQPDGKWRVLGASAVIVYDARHAAITPAGAPVLGATGITMHVLPAGSTFDPGSGEGVLPGGEQP